LQFATTKKGRITAPNGDSAVMTTVASPPRASRRGTASLRSTLLDLRRVLTKDLLNAYRPEKHYMRGPGPKWYERHALDQTLDRSAATLDEVYRTR
jgi:hypothetical protein